MSNTRDTEAYRAEMRAKLYRLAMDLRTASHDCREAYALSLQIEDLAERRYPEQPDAFGDVLDGVTGADRILALQARGLSYSEALSVLRRLADRRHPEQSSQEGEAA